MNIILTNQPPDAGDLLIPIVQEGSFDEKRLELATKLGVPEAVLARDFRAEANETFVHYASDGRKTYLEPTHKP